MVHTTHTIGFTSPESLKQYTLSYTEDGAVACSCPCYAYKGACKHQSLPFIVDWLKAIKTGSVRPAYAHECVHCGSAAYQGVSGAWTCRECAEHPSRRHKLTDLFAAA